jgi:bacillithiol biosynthesis cysteine-adding enzyme BshC
MQKQTLHRDKTNLFSPLSKELVYNQEKFSELISTPFSIEAFEKQIHIKNDSFSIKNRNILANVLQEQYKAYSLNENVEKNIQLIKESNTFTITTGHQLNLFTGPAYVIYKIIHVLKLTEALNIKFPQHNFVPIFWMASEDHDFDEINHTSLFGKKVSWTIDSSGPVGRLPLTNWEEIQNELHAFFSSDINSEIHRIIDKYQGEDLAEATKNILHYLFGDKGLVIINPDHRSLKSLFVPTFIKEIETAFVQSEVEATNVKIKALGFQPQAFVRPINIFYITNTSRERLLSENDKIHIPSLGTFSKEEIIEKIKNNPESFSPNVMMRPLYQETILPNLTYVGGGGEISYWIQQKGVFDTMQLPFPLLQVRVSVHWIDRQSHKKIHQLGLNVEQLFQSVADLQKKYLKENHGEVLDFSNLINAGESLSQQILSHSLRIDQTFEKYALAEISKVEKLIENIQLKLTKQKKSQSDIAMKQIEDLKSKLFPFSGLQERTESFFSICRDGEVSSKIELFYEAINPFEKDLILLFL